MPRGRLELPTTPLVVEPEDLRNFALFAGAKLNLSKGTAKHYVRRVKAFLKSRKTVTDRDIQIYIKEKKESCSPDYVSNIISAFKAYFRDYKGLAFMDGYRHPKSPLRMKEEISPSRVKRFIEAIDKTAVKCVALFLATSGLRKGEVLSLGETDINRGLRCIIPNCHSGKTKHSGISFYNSEAEACLSEFEMLKTRVQRRSKKLFPISGETFIRSWSRAREKSSVILKPKDLRDFFSQEMGKVFVPDRYIDIFQGRAPKSVLAKHYNPHGIEMLKEIYDKADLRVLG